MNAEHGIFHIHSTKWGFLSLKKSNPLLSSLWCSTYSTCSQRNPQQVDIWLSSKGWKNTFLLFACLFVFIFEAEISSGSVFSLDHLRRYAANQLQHKRIKTLIAIMHPAPRKRFAFGSLQHVTPEAAIRLNTFHHSNSPQTTHTPSYSWSIQQPY